MGGEALGMRGIEAGDGRRSPAESHLLLDKIPDSRAREMNSNEDKCAEQRLQRGEQSNFLTQRRLRAHHLGLMRASPSLELPGNG